MYNVKQTGLAVLSYGDLHGYFPPGTVDSELPPEQRLSWLTALLPFVEQEAVYRQIDQGQGWQAGGNQRVAQMVIPQYSCPAQPEGEREKLAPVVGLAGIGLDAPCLALPDRRAGIFGYERHVSRADITDGVSNTIMIIETRADNGPWMAGGHATVRGFDRDDAPYIGVNRPFGMKHRDDRWFRNNPLFATAMMADGSGRYLKETIDPATFQALATIAGDDTVGADY
jgi:Protein of unknown function (DUF1559)